MKTYKIEQEKDKIDCFNYEANITRFECEKSGVKIEMKEPTDHLKDFYPVFYYFVGEKENCRINEETFNAIKSMML